MPGKKKKRKQRGPSFYGSFIAFSGAAALFLFSVITLVFLSGKPSLPPFEERFSPLSGQIARIDRAIFTCLYKSRVPQKDILFETVQSKRKDRAEWDYTALSVRIPRQELVSRFEKELKRMLSSVADSVRVRWERRASGEVVAHIYAGAYPTHRIRIRSVVQRRAEPTKSPSSANAGRIRPPLYDNDIPIEAGADERSTATRQPRDSKVAIIVDDLGFDMGLAKSLMNLDLALSLSILPLAPFTKGIVEAAQGKACEIMLHLPMEPETYPQADAGPGALMTGMSRSEILRLVDEHLKRVPGARGVNNHMGSRFTESESGMGTLLSELKRRGLFYVDSRTTDKSIALEVAERLGVAAAKRSVFLDNDLAREAMAFQLQRLLAIARQSGEAIGIAHPHPETVAFLEHSVPLLKREAAVVHVSRLVK